MTKVVKDRGTASLKNQRAGSLKKDRLCTFKRTKFGSARHSLDSNLVLIDGESRIFSETETDSSGKSRSDTFVERTSFQVQLTDTEGMDFPELLACFRIEGAVRRFP